MNYESGECEDNDECAVGTHNCEALGAEYFCRNTQGSFRCEKKRCNLGEVIDEEGYCVKLECGTGFKPSQSGVCIVRMKMHSKLFYSFLIHRTLMNVRLRCVLSENNALTQWAAINVCPGARKDSDSTQELSAVRTLTSVVLVCHHVSTEPAASTLLDHTHVTVARGMKSLVECVRQ